MKLLMAVLILTSFSALASKCPKKSFEGEFKVIEVQGCENTQVHNHVDKTINRLDSDGDLEINIYRNSGSVQTLYSTRRVTYPNHEKCRTSRSIKYYRWYPNPSNDFYLGFLLKTKNYYVEIGKNCKYRLQKI